MRATSNSNNAGLLYGILVSFALLFHVFNNLQLSETIKIFHLFCAAAICVSFLLVKRNDSLMKSFYWLLIWALITSVVSPIEGSYLSAVKFIIIGLSVAFINLIPFKKLLLVVNLIIPIALLFLVRHTFIEPVYRYQGFYEDPNYFCTTLLVFYFYIQLLWKFTDKLFLRACLILEILIIFYLVSLSISRTGLLCLAIMTIVFWWDVFRNNKGKTVLAAFVLLAVVYYYLGDYVLSAIEGYTIRETENSDTLSSASHLRWEISTRGINYIFDHPLYLLQGIGIGTYSQAYVLDGWQASTQHIDHNTITSWFSEQGLIGFILLVRFFCILFNRLKSSFGLITLGLRVPCICTFGVFILFSLSINQTTYLPFWFLMSTMIALSEDNIEI